MTTQPASRTPELSKTDPGPRPVAAGVAILVATFFLILDLTVINVAFEPLQNDLGATFTDLQWILDSYATSMAGVLLFFGVCADRFGPRTVMITGAAIFAVASTFAALSTSVLPLIVSRGCQGIGAAALLASIPVLIVQNFAQDKRTIGFGIFGGASGIALAAGPIIGGVLLSWSWQWIFWINVPAMILVAAVLIPCKSSGDPQQQVARRLLSATVLGISMFSLVFVLTHAYDMGLTHPSILTGIVVTLSVFAAFVVMQRQPTMRLLDLGLFRNPTFVGINIVTLLVYLAVFPLILISVLYFEIVNGLDPIATGLRLMVLTGALLVGSILAMPLQTALGRKNAVTLSLVMLAAGLALLRLLAPDSTWTILIAGFVVAGVGLGIFSPLRAEGTAALVPEETTGMASGTGNTLQELGVACGVAFLGSVFLHRLNSSLGVDIDQMQSNAEADPSNSLTLATAFVEAWDLVVTLSAAVVIVALVVWLVSAKERLFRYEA
ncbi:MFS transporter [Rhodococcus sp. IEGM 1409]|uniref:MFS transporter n=1 Tax=Rhodococcus sp. IEGM 1409 TaxID=3047082 RepID=UPI0024B7161A|nr:MFS transporter [Rhodococcus sp. IEGM 1409]MDI9900506.1 MFS transporter [Rhodococcus sp. IEGM 1409]